MKLDFKIKLVPLDVMSKDKSMIPRSSAEEYLASESYDTRYNKAKLAFVGITHKDRKKTDSDLKNVGADDQVLANKNTVGRIDSLYIADDNYIWGKGFIFDPEDFSGQVREDIMYVQGLMKQGSILPASAVIDALWDNKMVARRILSIDGADITLNPAFTKAEIYSE